MDKSTSGCLLFALFLLIGVPTCNAIVELKVEKKIEVYEEKIHQLEERIIFLEEKLETIE